MTLFNTDFQDWGVAWFGNRPVDGFCPRCELHKPCYKGYDTECCVVVLMCADCCFELVRSRFDPTFKEK